MIPNELNERLTAGYLRAASLAKRTEKQEEDFGKFVMEMKDSVYNDGYRDGYWAACSTIYEIMLKDKTEEDDEP